MEAVTDTFFKHYFFFFHQSLPLCLCIACVSRPQPFVLWFPLWSLIYWILQKAYVHMSLVY